MKSLASQHVRGFTLVEILVAIGIIGLLLAILTPMLAGARGAAMRTGSQSNARECWRAIDLYCHSNSGAFPRCLPGVAYSIGFDAQTGLAFGSPDSAAWATAHYWPALLGDVIPTDELSGVLLAPGARTPSDRRDEETSALPSYVFSNSFVAKGALWTEPYRAASRDQLLTLIADVRTSEVSSPATKAALWDWDLPYLRNKSPYVGGLPADPTPIAFADGHVDARNPQESRAPTVNPLRSGIGMRLHDTPGGVQGHDF